MDEVDVYKTIEDFVEGEIHKVKGSKFIGYAIPVSNEEEVKFQIESIRKTHHKARHWCYAWRLGKENIKFRANDDGEPSNSAGQPILGQLISFSVTNTLVVVVRYFGGVKLGVGGLISAYKIGAKLVLEESKIITRTINAHFKLVFEYEFLDKVMRIIKEEGLKVENQKMHMQCFFEISVRKKDAVKIQTYFENLRCLSIQRVE